MPNSESRDNLPALSGIVTNYLCLAPEAKARAALSAFNDIGLHFLPEVPGSAAEAHALAKQGTLALTLAYMPDPASAGQALSPALDLRSVLFPPLVVLVDRAPTPTEQEALRIQGAAFILLDPPDTPRDAEPLRALARSSSWLSAKMDRMPLPDVLQTMAVHNQSGMVSIACKHTRFHSALPWEHNQKLCRARSGSNRECPGWYGRLYVRDGMLIHAETPTAEGVPALAQLLRASAGSVRIHEVFILPGEPNITGSMHSNLLNAAWVADEDARTAPPSIPVSSVPGQRGTHPPSAGSPSTARPSSDAISSRAEASGARLAPAQARAPAPAAKEDAGQLSSIDSDWFTSQPSDAPAEPAPETSQAPAPATGPIAPFEPGQVLLLTDFELTFPSSSVPDEPIKRPNLPRPAGARPAPRPLASARRTAPEVTVIEAPPLDAEPITSGPAPQISDLAATPKAPEALPAEIAAPPADSDPPKTNESPPMPGLEALLKAAPDLRTAAKADNGGSVLETAGNADAETISAVVALSLKSLAAVEELAGLGSLRSWTVASSTMTLYVQHQPDGFVAALGSPTKNAEATMRIVTEHAGAGRVKG